METRWRGKRMFDLLVLVVSAPVTVPLLLLCAIAVILTSRGPALFRQERVGLHGRPFTMLKFRTMVDAPNPVIPDPARITGIGRVLRRTSIDELPQLINVARGDMSIVGPRPTLAYQVERYDDRQRRRLAVRPGLTGLAQVRGRNRLSWADRIECDLEYLDSCSLRVDVRIVMGTVVAVLGGGGVDGHSADDPISAPPPSDAGRGTARRP